jgi:non-reducing end alpha-L-arabinofuranosidase
MLGSGGNSVGAGGAAGGQGQTGGAGGSGDGGRSGRLDGGTGSVSSGGATGGLDAAVGGQSGSGGITPTGGGAGSGGATGTGGIHDGATDGGDAGSTGTGPCDLYQAGNTPCVAAHSTVRALYGAYGGNLYQVRRASDKTTKDIGVLTSGGYANSATQESFCSGTTCTISVIYDQSPNGNHLTKAPAGGWLNNGGLEADASKAKATIKGHTVYGVYTTSNFDNDVGAVGYRNNKTKAVPTGDQPESMYMVASGKHYNQWCCFDYGNAETNNKDNGPATMETVYFGNSTQWGRGSGSGPWVMADLEDGVFAGGSTAAPASNTPLVADYVTVMLKGPSGNRFALKGGDAQSGSLITKYDGARPSGYSPQKKEGAIILGIGGDNSHTGEGTFFEGCMTAGNPSDAVDDAVQANIVAAGYGR